MSLTWTEKLKGGQSQALILLETKSADMCRNMCEVDDSLIFHKEVICVVLPQYQPPVIIPLVRCIALTERCLRSLVEVRSGTLKSDTKPHKKALH